ncbi:MAG: hypothetical protein NT166_31515 [Candidatus Aminicenantes bacterium]|nr:hypothetical protein [Candidatus Aminicenantes bacterium]
MQGHHTGNAAGIEPGQEKGQVVAMTNIQAVLDVYQLGVSGVDGFQEDAWPIRG